MDNRKLGQNLQENAQKQFDDALKNGDVRQACAILHQAGLDVDAMELAENSGYNEEAIDYAIASGELEQAERLARKINSQQKLADILTLRG